jgi:putative transposase
MQKVVPSERLRRELDDVLNAITEEQDPIEVVARLGARLILQQALEDEVSDFVGRSRYERADGSNAVIYRNGFAKPSTVRTTSGPTVIERPRVRDATKVGFESQVLGKGVARTHALEALVICSFLRGLSVRDVEAALQETFGEQVISKSTVARVCKDVADRYAACPPTISSTATWTRSTSSCARATSPPRASWSPGGSRWRARRCCSGCSSDPARATNRGLTSAAT